jgi:Mg-chelatase subunit ChlD
MIMKSKLFTMALVALTLGAVFIYPTIEARDGNVESRIDQRIMADQRPVIDVVFVLDTTGSMSGLIQTAKEKIWSIASTMASAQPTPQIRVGLVGYRDRGDAYVTRVVDLNADLDAVYTRLMAFEAGGGGDTPESVNQALYEAVHNMNWSDRDQAYQAIFLVGDAPPHMDYNEVQYPAIVAAATEKGIVINTIQCGNLPTTVDPWTAIARLGRGDFFQVEQSGSAVAYATPFDEEIAELAAQLDATRLYYGSEEDRKRSEAKMDAAATIEGSASVASRARRGIFNASTSGRDNLLGDQELVAAVASGEVELEELDEDVLPEALKPMAPAEQQAYVGRLAKERADIQERIRQLSTRRDEFISQKVEEAGGAESSLDMQLYKTVRDQAGKAGLEYEGGPSY